MSETGSGAMHCRKARQPGNLRVCVPKQLSQNNSYLSLQTIQTMFFANTSFKVLKIRIFCEMTIQNFFDLTL